MEIKFSFYRTADNSFEFSKEVSNVCFSIAPKGVVKVKSENGISTIYYVYEEKPWLPGDKNEVVMMIGMCDEGSIKDMGYPTNGPILKLETGGIHNENKIVKDWNF